jgi:hypothetical protein
VWSATKQLLHLGDLPLLRGPGATQRRASGKLTAATIAAVAATAAGYGASDNAGGAGASTMVPAAALGGSGVGGGVAASGAGGPPSPRGAGAGPVTTGPVAGGGAGAGGAASANATATLTRDRSLSLSGRQPPVAPAAPALDGGAWGPTGDPADMVAMDAIAEAASHVLAHLLRHADHFPPQAGADRLARSARACAPFPTSDCLS